MRYKMIKEVPRPQPKALYIPDKQDLKSLEVIKDDPLIEFELPVKECRDYRVTTDNTMVGPILTLCINGFPIDLHPGKNKIPESYYRLYIESKEGLATKKAENVAGTQKRSMGRIF